MHVVQTTRAALLREIDLSSRRRELHYCESDFSERWTNSETRQIGNTAMGAAISSTLGAAIMIMHKFPPAVDHQKVLHTEIVEYCDHLRRTVSGRFRLQSKSPREPA